MSLIFWIGLYILVTVAVGLLASRNVRASVDYALAGRSLGLPIVIATTFATFFGAETCLGIPARWIDEGLAGIVEDPFGAGMALILVGLFFARKLYSMTLLTLGDYYRYRYGHVIEVLCSVFVIISYLGWVAAQVAALGFLFNIVTEGAIPVNIGMVIGTAIVIFYTMYGGMWSVAMTDFLQMILIVIGLLAIAYVATGLAGGTGKVIEFVQQKDLLRILPEPGVSNWLFWISAAMTMMIGSIPQQDVFQRVMSAKDANTSAVGPVIGGAFYILFAFVPMFVAATAFLVMPERCAEMMADDSQKILPTLVRDYMPMPLRVLFFGAVLSAILSTASATVLAPTTTFVENVLRHFVKMGDRGQLLAMRCSTIVFGLCVLVFALLTEGSPIYDMVTMAYQFPVVGAFWPLVGGLYWKRSTTFGALMSIVIGGASWAVLTWTPLGETIPNVLGGFVIAGASFVVFSLVGPKSKTLYGMISGKPDPAAA